MLGNPHGHGPVNAAKRTDPRPFLSSFRALSVRLREFDCLTEAAARGVAALAASDSALPDKPVVRRSPDRCVIQFGEVALTLAWLRHTLDSAAEGELLVVVWRGLIASRGITVSDRTTTNCTPVRSATVVWEEVLQAVAVDEPSWLWRPAGADIGGYRSAELAERCVERLQLAARDVAAIV
jgi:hypothetical protein